MSKCQSNVLAFFYSDNAFVQLLFFIFLTIQQGTGFQYLENIATMKLAAKVVSMILDRHLPDWKPDGDYDYSFFQCNVGGIWDATNDRQQEVFFLFSYYNTKTILF